MKSRIDKSLIVPSCLFEDRTIKCKCGNRWTKGLTDTDDGYVLSKSSRARKLALVRATVNPDNIFVDECEYYDEDGGWVVPIKVEYQSRYSVLYCYKRNRLSSNWQ